MLDGKKPDPEKHPNLYAWAAMTTKFAESVSSKWPAGVLRMPDG